jgi:diguanylate cyclase (GGDEF)-like protein
MNDPVLATFDAATFLASEAAAWMTCFDSEQVVTGLAQSLQRLHQAERYEIGAMRLMNDDDRAQPFVGRYLLIDGPSVRVLEMISPQRVGGQVGQLGEHLLIIAQRWLTAVSALAAQNQPRAAVAQNVPQGHDAERLAWMTHLTHCLEAAQRHAYGVACIHVDIKAFKALNDVLGASTARNLLYEMGTRIMTMLRKHDRVIRLGDHEFGIIIDRLMQPDGIAAVIQRLMSKLENPPSPLTPWKGVRLGMALFPNDATTAEDLVALSHLRLTDAKHRDVLEDERWAREMRAQSLNAGSSTQSELKANLSE